MLGVYTGIFWSHVHPHFLESGSRILSVPAINIKVDITQNKLDQIEYAIKPDRHANMISKRDVNAGGKCLKYILKNLGSCIVLEFRTETDQIVKPKSLGKLDLVGLSHICV